jgi:hypothetical protein
MSTREAADPRAMVAGEPGIVAAVVRSVRVAADPGVWPGEL